MCRSVNKPLYIFQDTCLESIYSGRKQFNDKMIEFNGISNIKCLA